MKILVDVKSGMNDCISMLNYMLQYCHKNNLSYNNIYFRSVTYEFSNYFDIKTINYIRSDDEPRLHLFDKVILIGSQGHTLKNIDQPYHVSNFLNIKQLLLKNHEEYRDYVGIHCRTLYGNYAFSTNFVDTHIKQIEKIISENEKVCIFSDSDELFKYLPTGKNIIHEKTGVEDMTKYKQRRSISDITVQHIVKLGKCKKIYVTNGGFWKLPKAFVNKNLLVNHLTT
jgi:hypothetical protein